MEWLFLQLLAVLLNVSTALASQLGFEAQPEARATDGRGMDVKLTLSTSAVEGAGTTDEVYVTFHGTHFDSPELALSAGTPTPTLERGLTVTTTLSLPDHIGSLVSLRLRHGGVDAWRFTAVSAATDGGARVAVFSRHNSWLVRTDENAATSHQSPQPAQNPDPNTTPGVETVMLYVVRKSGIAIDGVAGQVPL